MKIFRQKEKSIKAQSSANKQGTDVSNILVQLFSPAIALALLGTVALVFSFYRAGQLSSLVIPKDQPPPPKKSPFADRPKIDINSQALIDAADNSEAALLAQAGDSQQAVIQAFKDLTDNPPDYLPTIVEAGDILSEYGNDKDLGFGLLERAVIMAPGNKYLTLRYCQNLANDGKTKEAEPKLLQLFEKNREWTELQIFLSKIHFFENKIPTATTELIGLSNNKNLDSKQEEQIALMLGKLGRTADGFPIFQKAANHPPKDSFYTSYCRDWVSKSPGSYDTVLAMIKTNLAENKNSAHPNKQLSLEIKQAALLLLLGRAKDAQNSLESVITVNPKSFDAHLLQATAYVILGQNDKAKTEFQKAIICYQPKY